MSSLKQPLLCWQSHPLFYPIFLETSTLSYHKISVMASPKVLFAYFFLEEKVGGQRKFHEFSEATVALLAVSSTFLPNILGNLNPVFSKNFGDGFT